MTARTIQRIRAKLTYANVTATLALVLALGGGTAWAASKIRTKQIGYHAVTGAKLDTNAVTASKLRNGAVRTDDVKDGSLQAADLAPGAIPPAEATIWGVVTSGGALVSGEGVTGAVAGNDGITTLTFPHDVSRCAAVATVGGTTPEERPAGRGRRGPRRAGHRARAGRRHHAGRLPRASPPISPSTSSHC